MQVRFLSSVLARYNIIKIATANTERILVKLSKDTWHYHNWEFWLKHSYSDKTYDFKPQHVWYYETREKAEAEANAYPSRGDIVVEDDLITGGFKLITRPRRQVNLCLYFWVAVLRAPLVRFRVFSNHHPIISGIIFALIATAVLGTLVNIFDDNLGTWWHPYAFVFGGIATIVGSVALIVGGAILMVEHINPWLQERRQTERRPTNKPNLLVAQVKAKKSKVCPILEFEE